MEPKLANSRLRRWRPSMIARAFVPLLVCGTIVAPLAAAPSASAASIGDVTNFGSGSANIEANGEPDGIVAGSDGALWFLNGANSIGRISTSGVVTDVTNSSFNQLSTIVAGPGGTLLVINRTAPRFQIEEIDTSGSIVQIRRAHRPRRLSLLEVSQSDPMGPLGIRTSRMSKPDRIQLSSG